MLNDFYEIIKIFLPDFQDPVYNHLISNGQQMYGSRKYPYLPSLVEGFSFEKKATNQVYQTRYKTKSIHSLVKDTL